MKLVELIDAIEKVAPLNCAAAWDKSGVQVASFAGEVSHVAVTLDPSLASVEAALAQGADYIVAHHPLAMQARFPDRADDYLRTLSLLLSHKVGLYSAHTSLDANPQGPVTWLAQELGLANLAVLAPETGGTGSAHGFGFVGDLPEAVSYDTFCQKIAQGAGICHWRRCGAKPATVGRVACCPGSGSELAFLARSSGAEVLITGDCKYHGALEAPVCILDVGHFSLEEEMMRRFALQLDTSLDLRVSFIPAGDPFFFESL